MAHEDFICPVCGAEVPAKAAACPECGSDERTGWSANTIYDGTDIDDPDDFDYEDWKRREFGKPKPPTSLTWFWWLVAVGASVILVWTLL